MIEQVLRDFLMLWATIDPVGTLALFAAVTPAVTGAERRSIALRATLYSAVILIASIVIGQIILILVRVMGMLLAALSVELVMEALGIERWVHTKL